MTREKLPTGRHGVRVPVIFTTPDHQEFTFLVTYNIGASSRVVECFVSHDDTIILKSGSLLRAILEDGCIAISLLLQHGMTMEAVARRLGENRPEGTSEGPPSSPLGAIACTGADIDRRIEE